jgi:hypothetical protein
VGKFYVSSGELRRILTAPDSKAAALRAIRKSACVGDDTLAPLTRIDERGFNTDTKETVYRATAQLLVEAGVADGYDMGEDSVQ